MPLLQPALAQLIAQALKAQSQDGNTPSSAPLPTDSALEALSGAYHSWVLAGFPPAPFSFVSPPVQQTLKSGLNVPLFGGWGPGLSAYWASATLTAPGLIPVNPLDPSTLALLPTLSSQLTSALASMITTAATDKNETIDGLADKLSARLLSFTMSLMFMTTTTSVPPATATLPVA